MWDVIPPCAVLCNKRHGVDQREGPRQAVSDAAPMPREARDVAGEPMRGAAEVALLRRLPPATHTAALRRT